ncbi:uncharacterized protein VTP21DRAFT_9570 [Calcarisporiella thermophila]|uniref:uncharacterized protein n=1 Tax=Calcarisporiella thermophila TaxID=911321 RepID=UPI003743CBA6
MNIPFDISQQLPWSPPPTPGKQDALPTPDQFESIIDDYLSSLSPKKRDKALITQDMYDHILRVLLDPRNTQNSTAQFRFWSKRMFTLAMHHGRPVILHEGKPVAVREEIYDILVRCHRAASHGGRDKTSSLIRRHYSWIPKELVARFVRSCPYCTSRRVSVRTTPTSPATTLSSSPPAHLLHFSPQVALFSAPTLPTASSQRVSPSAPWEFTPHIKEEDWYPTGLVTTESAGEEMPSWPYQTSPLELRDIASMHEVIPINLQEMLEGCYDLGVDAIGLSGTAAGEPVKECGTDGELLGLSTEDIHQLLHSLTPMGGAESESPFRRSVKFEKAGIARDERQVAL